MSDSTHPSDEALGQALDAFEREQATGDVDVQAFAARYPLIRQRLLAALQMHRQLSKLEARAAPAAPLPKRLGRYSLEEELGRGGMAPVLRARDEELQRDVALKILLPDPLRPDRRVRFLREARALARIVHPHVVTIFDVGEDADLAYFAMERLEGSLQERFGSPHYLRWGLEAALGLAAAHAAGVLHRDVKPGNLLLGADGKVRVGDFGLAWHTGDESLTATGQVMGTVRYASPEQLSGLPVTATSDVYSLGASLRDLSSPRPGSGSAPTRSAPLYGRLALAPVSSLPRAVAAVLTKATSEEPAARYPSMQAFADDLRALVEGRRPAAAARRRAPFAVAAAVIAIGAGAAWPWLSSSEAPELLDESRLLWSGPASSVEGAGAPEQSLTVAGKRFELALEPGPWLRVTRPGSRVRMPLAPLGLEPGTWQLLPCVDSDRDGVPDVVLSTGTRAAIVKLYPKAFEEPALGWVQRLPAHFNYGSPAVVGREIYLGDDGSDLTTGLASQEATVFVLDVETGALRARHRIPGAVMSTVQEHGAALFIDADKSATASGGLFRLTASGAVTALGPSDFGGGLTWPVFTDTDGDGTDEAIVGSLAGRLFALPTAAAGPPRWTVQLDGQLSYPVLDDGRVCVSSEGHFQCVDAKTGALLWQVELKAGCVARPLVLGGRLACGSGRGDSAVYLVDSKGVARTELPAAAHCRDPGQPCFAARLVQLGDGRIIGATTSGFLLAWRPAESGLVELFAHDVGAPVVGTPVPYGAGVLVTSYDGWLRYFRLDGEEPTVVFAYRAHGPIGSTPAIVDGKWAVFSEVGPRVYKVPLPAP